MESVTSLTERVTSLPFDASPSEVVALADEVEAFALTRENVGEQVLTALLVRLARRLTKNAPPTLGGARLVIALATAGENARRADRVRDETYQSAYDVVRDAIASGMSQSDAARVSGFDRMTVRRAIGKPVYGSKKSRSSGSLMDSDTFDAMVLLREDSDEDDFALTLADSPRSGNVF